MREAKFVGSHFRHNKSHITHHESRIASPMSTNLILTGAILAVLVFLSTIESSYEALNEVSLKLMSTEREGSPRRMRFFRELMEHRRRFELILILGTQLSIAAIAILLADVLINVGARAPLALAFVASFV